jgi:hypothetical protein
MAIFRQGHALIVGVGGDLPGTIADAVGIADVLVDPTRCAYPPDQVHLLTGANAGREHILAALEMLSQSADPQSIVFVYFSGHGYQVLSPTGEFYYFMPYGYDLDQLYRTAVSGAELIDRLRAVPVQKLLVLLDCCHPGTIGEARASGLHLAKSPVPPESRGLLAEGRGLVLVASSREDELSFGGRPYGVFALAVIESLCGQRVAEQDGYVCVADLVPYVREVVARRTAGRQHPTVCIERADDFTVAYYAAGEPYSKGLPFAGQPQVETEPGAWGGSVLSGDFAGPVAVGGGEAVDMREAHGAVYKPTGPVEQHFGDRINITGDGNVVGDGSTSRVVKVDVGGEVQGGTIITAGGDVVLGSRPGEEPDLAPSPEARRLQRVLRTRLDLEELRTLCFDLGVSCDSLGGEGLSAKARQLVLFLQKRDALSLLVDWLRQERPDIGMTNDE